MSRPVITANKDMTIKEAVKIMDENNFGSIPVIDNNGPIGIITERDVLRRVLAKDLNHKLNVAEIMTKEVVTIPYDADLEEVSRLMSENNFRRLIVVKEKEVVGIVTAKDVMEILSDKNGKRKSM